MILTLYALSALSGSVYHPIVVTAQAQPVTVTDYSFYKGNLSSTLESVTRVNGYLRNETSAKIFVRLQYLTDVEEVVGVARFYSPDETLVQLRLAKYTPRKAGDTSIWSFETDMIGQLKNNTGIWRVELYHGPYDLVVARFTVGDYLANIGVTGLPSKFVTRLLIDDNEAGMIRGGERKPWAFMRGTHKVAVDALVEGEIGTRYYCYRNYRNVSAETTHLFEYSTEHYLRVTSLYGEIKGSGWYQKGSNVSFSVEATVYTAPGTRYVFSRWVDDYKGDSPRGTIIMDGAKNVTAVHRVQYQLKVISKYADIKGEGWYDDGVTVQLSAPSIVVLPDMTKAVFVKWSGDMVTSNTVLSVAMRKPFTVNVDWRVEATQPILSREQSIPIAIGGFVLLVAIAAFFVLPKKK